MGAAQCPGMGSGPDWVGRVARALQPAPGGHCGQTRSARVVPQDHGGPPGKGIAPEPAAGPRAWPAANRPQVTAIGAPAEPVAPFIGVVAKM